MGVGSMNSTPQTSEKSLSHSKPSLQFFWAIRTGCKISRTPGTIAPRQTIVLAMGLSVSDMFCCPTPTLEHGWSFSSRDIIGCPTQYAHGITNDRLSPDKLLEGAKALGRISLSTLRASQTNRNL